MKKRDLITVIVFIFFIIGPTIVYWFVKDKMNLENYENRNLYMKPELKFSDIFNYPKKYENYLNDNIAFKNELRNLRAQILYKFFNTSSNTKVIVGKNGWLFFNGIAINDGNPILEYRNITSYTEEEKHNIKEELINANNYLAKKDIDLYVFIIPNKENVYSDYLEETVKKSEREKSKTEELIDYLNEKTKLNILYPKDVLVENRNKYDTYCKYDTHWNNYGSYLGTIELIKKINKEFKEPEIQIENQKQGGDLLNMNSIYTNLQNDEPLIKGFYDNNEYICNEGTEFKECTCENAIYDKTILIVGDSFRSAMVQYISKVYSKTIIVHRGYYKEDYIEKYNPDIVVFEVVERYTDTLKDIKMLIK